MDEKEIFAINELSREDVRVKRVLIIFKVLSGTSSNFNKVCRYLFGNNIYGLDIIKDFQTKSGGDNGKYLQFIYDQDEWEVLPA